MRPPALPPDPKGILLVPALACEPLWLCLLRVCWGAPWVGWDPVLEANLGNELLALDFFSEPFGRQSPFRCEEKWEEGSRSEQRKLLCGHKLQKLYSANEFSSSD